MNLNHLCMGCMQEKSGQGKSCPYCGYDDKTEQNEPHQLPIWTILKGSYVVGKALGNGGFGITYIGYDLNLQRKVAIKEFFPENFAVRGEDKKTVQHFDGERGEFFKQEKQRYVEEARILAQIEEQPGVVKVLNYFQENNTAYIAMEYLEGQSLMSRVKAEGKLPVAETLELLRPVIQALAGIHEKGVVHKDISPDNIMITRDGKVKLIDFGAAMDKHGDVEELRVYKESYSPLEQRDEEDVIGAYSDIYALCATIYRCITGEKPLNPVSRKAQDLLKKPSELGIAITPLQEAALMSGLELMVDDRIKNASDLYYFLYQYGKNPDDSVENMHKKIKESSTKVIMDKMRKEKVRKQNKNRLFIGGIAVALAVLVLFVGRMIINAVMENKNGKPVVTNTDSDKELDNDKEDDTQAVTAADLEDYREKLYELINKKRENAGKTEAGISEVLEKTASACVTDCVNAGFETTAEWNSAIVEFMQNAMADNAVTNTGWLVLPYSSNVSLEQVISDAETQIAAINKDIEGALDFYNCYNLGIAVGVHKDGTLFFAFLYQ